jgi:hypothetical protein
VLLFEVDGLLMADLPHYSGQIVRRGRPTSDTDEDEVKFPLSKGFFKSKVAKVLRVSRQTLYNKSLTWIPESFRKFTDIPDRVLDQKIKDIKSTHTNNGEVMMIGHLRSQGIQVPRSKLRVSLHRIDPEGIARRRSTAVKRRIYHVEGANSVWHIDGNHKMIRWRIVVHGGIDGYSRLITFSKCHTEKSTSVLSVFRSGVDKYGLPKSVRTDHGGENIGIWRHMLEERSSSNCVITGSSTHNERIERLWRDVHQSVTVTFADTFRELKSEYLLDSLNEVDIYCLHMVYLPEIRRGLDTFVSAWNNHPISTEHNQTSDQLFFTSFTTMPEDSGPDCTDSEDLEDVVSNLPDSAAVTVPRCSFYPCDNLKQLLEGTLAGINDSTKARYKAIINVCGQHLTGNCSNCNN